MVQICSWCLSLLRITVGCAKVSHGICKKCFDILMVEDYVDNSYENLWIDLGGES